MKTTRQTTNGYSLLSVVEWQHTINVIFMSKTKKILQVVTVVVLGLVLVGSGFWLGWDSGTKHPQNITVSGATNILSNASGTPSAADFSVFWQAWQDINQYYLRNPSTTSQTKMYGAITGMLGATGDPYTEFFSPADSQQFQQDITGDFGGIGAELGTNASSGAVVVISPLAGTPALKAGLKPEDAIVAVNGSSTVDMNVDDVVNLVRGPEGSTVTLSIMRAGWKAPQDFKIVRANIQVPTVSFEMKGDIAHITLNEFTQDADGLFYAALEKSVNAHAQGMVLDLRGDPGGYLEVAVDLAGYFLKPGSAVVKEVGRTVPEQDFTASGNGALDTMPMAILIDGGSASAAEILSGALHDDRSIPLVGEKSFGKGTVQQLSNLSDGSSLKITVAHWVMPSGRILDYDGIVPDYVVPISDADIKNGNDPQLAKALTVVQDEINGTALPPKTVATSTATTTAN
jgi:carboxyl-terminal processing protease